LKSPPFGPPKIKSLDTFMNSSTILAVQMRQQQCQKGY